MRKITRNIAAAGLVLGGIALLAPINAFAADNSDLTVTAIVVGNEADSSGGGGGDSCTPVSSVTMESDIGGMIYQKPITDNADNNGWQWQGPATAVSWTTDGENCTVENGGSGPATAPIGALVAWREPVEFASDGVVFSDIETGFVAGALPAETPGATASALIDGGDTPSIVDPTLDGDFTIDGIEGTQSSGTFSVVPLINVFSSGSSPLAGSYVAAFRFYMIVS
jgi:hypothetical protein